MPKLPLPPLVVPVDQSLDGLAPKFRACVENILKAMPDAMVYETLRTDARQSYLYGFGRDWDDGRGVVTHSETAQDTWHHYGLACDIIHKTRGWGAPTAWWDQLGAEAKKLGLVWGGNWTFHDDPHVQWGAPMRRSPSPSAAKLQAEGGNAAVWKVVGAA
jgi:hypothetical protein